MRRWNGWGDDAIEAPAPTAALQFLAQAIGPGTPQRSATLADACARLERDHPSRLAGRNDLPPLVSTRTEDRIRHGAGQSLGDWIGLRFGNVGPVADGIARPQTSAQVRELLEWAATQGVVVIPCGGATSVAGHLQPPDSDRACVILDMRRMNALLELDAASQLARFQAGIVGPDIEAALAPQGFMLGHFPQSYEYATLGGWIASRSSGQQSLRYGRIEQLFAGGVLETPRGTLSLPPFPASAAGPDLREQVLGSEGRVGVITEAIVRVTRRPDVERFVAVFLPDWDAGVAATRTLVQLRTPLSMLRLSNPIETETLLRLAGHGSQVAWLERYLGWRGARAGKVMMMLGLTGTRAQVEAAWSQAHATLRSHAGVSVGTKLGDHWKKSRYAGVYLRNALWDAGYAIDTMETAIPWSATAATVPAMETAGREALAQFGERCHAYTHLSHVYGSGSSAYTTFLFRIGPDQQSTHARWAALKRAVSEAIVASGGTISHQHGVGRDHAPYVVHEKGPVGMAAIEAGFAHFDPTGVLDSGNVTGPGRRHDGPGAE
jgi:alkyldihydroxyacetonephosphate synthase